MKVYYDLPDQSEVDAELSSLRQKSPEEYRHISNLLLDIIEERQRKHLIALMDGYKYKLMWDLRALEQAINDEGGALILTQNGGVQMKGFSASLMKKITEALQHAKK